MGRQLKQAALVILLTIANGSVCLVHAWNRTGHKVISYIAYNRLSSTAKENIGRLIRQHPDFPALTSAKSKAFGDRTLTAFLEASVWPDRIRNDPRFYDEADAGKSPHQLQPGFPDMSRHQSWHYIDNFFSQDGTPLPSGKPPGEALRQIESIQNSLSDLSIPASIRAYQLSWLVHIVEDVHQPLHCAARFTQYQKDIFTGAFIGDQGGNLVFVEGADTLHWYWDSALGNREDRQFMVEMSAKAERETFPSDVIQAAPKRWIEEGFEISKKNVYQFRGRGTQSSPLQLPSSYRKMAVQIAQQRVALGGIRLANILETIFGN